MGAVNLACIDDDAAKEHSNRLAVGHEVELWRLVARSNSGDVPRRRGAHTQGPRFSHFNNPLERSYFPWMRLQVLPLFDAGTLALRLNGLSGAVGAALDNGASFHFQSLKADDADIAAVAAATSLSDTCRDSSVVDAVTADLGQRIGRANGTVEHPGRQLRP
ncbi:hypothetical protein NKJ36_29260 [Mesorhizobium sp. M0142]|uniref:hypothetical protein n=1 Tax=Mesorhizobium sp. M0142 TaxID=2956894 RepID=UPI00333B9625